MKTMVNGARAAWLVVGVSLLLAACGQDEEASQAGSETASSPPRPAQVMQIERQDIPLDKSYPSMLRSDDEVTLVARVTGFLEERHFEPGEMVEKGQLLYSIEPDMYEATVNQREADLQSARAELSRAQRDAERFERLLSQNSVSRQDYDQARAELGVAQASVAQAEAALASANLDLNYAQVQAPVSGMIGLSEINVGNLVSPGTELATITPLDPLEVRFQLPQRDAFELRRQLDNEERGADIRATLTLPGAGGDESGELVGRLDFLGSRVDSGTSTVQATATFDNPQATVLPGQFVRVSLEGLQRFDVFAVPEIAVTQGLMGPQVFVLDDENKARSRTVSLGELAGPWQILRDGLEEGERVIVGDPSGIEPGTDIEPRKFSGNAEDLVEDIEAEEQAEAEAQAEEAREVTEAGAAGGVDAPQGEGDENE
ncbi:efflux RND transporter periplasmic adaptor subunit [Halomonas sp. Bachu 37]|uniref:efflux RND transporter periplasmic adaptor subunit n=1 Tax=Halomonas kashgarensis TaxID=3084920 RepID=UPI0032174B3D